MISDYNGSILQTDKSESVVYNSSVLCAEKSECVWSEELLL